MLGYALERYGAWEKGGTMKKIVDDVRLIFKCCSLYYQDGLGQKEICELLGISRPTVSRMLTIGKERGIVRIEIQNPDNIAYGQLDDRQRNTRVSFSHFNGWFSGRYYDGARNTERCSFGLLYPEPD